MNKGFTLIELLVVIAILGIISAIGVVAYNGYVEISKSKSAENIIQQIGLAQSEYFSVNQTNYTQSGACDSAESAKVGTSLLIETNLFEGSEIILENKEGEYSSKVGYNFCIQDDAEGEYIIHAYNGKKIISLTSMGQWTKD